MAITHVIFDLSEVLLTGIKDTGHNLGKKHGIDPASVLVGPNGHANPLMIPAVWEFFHGDLTEDQYIAEVVKLYPKFGPHDELKRHIRENFKEIEGTRGIVERVRAAGYRLALLSVHSKEWIEHCEAAHKIHDLFHTVVYSYMDKVSKPQPEAFLRTLERLKASPEECMFIDDSKKNVDAATQLGFIGIQFVTAKALEAELVLRLPNFK